MIAGGLQLLQGMIVVSLETIGHGEEVGRLRLAGRLYLPRALLPKGSHAATLSRGFKQLLVGQAVLRSGIARAGEEVRKRRGSVVEIRVDGLQVLMREQEARVDTERRIA